MPLVTANGINQRRQSIDDARQQAGLESYRWTDHPVTTSTPIKAVHFAELRAAVQDLWNRKRLGSVPPWSAPTPPAPTRTTVETDSENPDTWEAFYRQSTKPISPQGITSISFDPLDNRSITPDWCQNAAEFTGTGPKLLIRLKIRASPNGSINFGQYITAIQTWKNAGFDDIAVVLPYELKPAAGGWNNNTWPNGTLTGLTNAFITQWRATAITVMQNLWPLVKQYWIWNEPNIKGIINSGINPDSIHPTSPPGESHPEGMSPENFAALLYTTGLQMKSIQNSVSIYAGALSVLYGLTDQDQAGQFYDRVYGFLRNEHQITSFPWDQVSVNMELYPTTAYIQNVKQAIHDAQAKPEFNHVTTVILSEWGNEDFGPNPPVPPPTEAPSDVRDLYNRLKREFSLMYFFCHNYPGDKNYGSAQIAYGTPGVYDPDYLRRWGYYLTFLYPDQS